MSQYPPPHGQQQQQQYPPQQQPPQQQYQQQPQQQQQYPPQPQQFQQPPQQYAAAPAPQQFAQAPRPVQPQQFQAQPPQPQQFQQPPQPQQQQFQQPPQPQQFQQPQPQQFQQPQQPQQFQQPPQQQFQQPQQPQQPQQLPPTPTGGPLKRSNSRIDPKQIPREEVERAGSEVTQFFTRSGRLPPRATATYMAVDEGNCTPRFIRLTTNQVAQSEELTESTKLVVGAMLQPLAEPQNGEEQVPVVDTHGKGPVRCRRCHAYVCPSFRFQSGGSTMECSLCGHSQPVPDHYVSNLDGDGRRRDVMERPELHRGSVEYVATPEFVFKPARDPCYLFVVDASRTALQTGLLESAIVSIRASLDSVASNERARAGIVSYAEAVHFFSVNPERSEPQMYVVGEVNDVFVPAPPGDLLVRVSDERCRALLDTVLDLLPVVHEEATSAEGCAFGAAVKAGLGALETFGGKLLVTQSALPGVGEGALKARDDVALYHTDKEKTLFLPQNAFYHSLASKCATAGVTVDIFVGANSYVDIATTGALAQHTGGQVYHYEAFTAAKDGDALYNDIVHNVARPTGYEGVMAVRCSKGLRVTDYYGAFYRREQSQLELPTIDSDKAFGVLFTHDAKLAEPGEAVFQCALLYTTAQGERRIRVHTISVPVTSALANIYRNADLDTIVALSLKQACKQILHKSQPVETRTALTKACVDCLYVYRKFCASASSSGQLILPEPLKLLPLSSLGLIKNPVFHAGQRADERSYVTSVVASMPTYVASTFIVPRLFSLTDIPWDTCVPDDDNRVFLPPTLSLSSESVRADGAYLLDTGRALLLWLGENVEPDVIYNLFDVDVLDPNNEVQPSHYRLSAAHYDDPDHLSTRVQQLLFQLRLGRAHYPVLTIVAHPRHYGSSMLGGSLDQTQFFKHLVEDKGQQSGEGAQAPPPKKKGEEDPSRMSYVDYLCFIHGRIQAKFY